MARDRHLDLVEKHDGDFASARAAAFSAGARSDELVGFVIDGRALVPPSPDVVVVARREKLCGVYSRALARTRFTFARVDENDSVLRDALAEPEHGGMRVLSVVCLDDGALESSTCMLLPHAGTS